MSKEEVCLILCVVLLLSSPVQVRYCSRYTRALDAVFMLDSSSDTSDADWNLMTRLLRDAAYQLHASTFGTHIAHVQFTSNTSVVHGLGTELQGSFDRPESSQTGRNVSDALFTTRRLVLNNMDGDRPEVPDVIVLVVNGPSDDKSSAISEATSLKSEGIRIIAVGVTSTQVDQLREELREISTDPDDVNSLMLINRNYLSAVLSYLVQAICRNRVEAASVSIRLVDGTSHTGRLEVYINEEWVTVCSTNWTHWNTETACKQLGFPAGHSMYTMNHTFYHRRVGVANIQCRGRETNLISCPHDPFFHIDPSCDHQQDVFLRCLCGECNDYIPADNVRLADRTSISGRLEVFSPGLGWGGVCSTGWTTFNTRVTCRQLGFLDGAGIYKRNQNPSVTLVLFHVNCFGNESTLFHCNYATTSRETCTNPVHIQCECHRCIEFLLQAPQQKEAMTQSSAVFEWRLKHNVTAFEFLFLSQKNPQSLMYVEADRVVHKHTRFRHRMRLINVDYETVGFSLTDITVADMGIYSLHVPNRLLDSIAVLIVKDFAVVPNPVVHREINDRVVLSWDLTALRQLHDASHKILLTTPATGRLNLDYYNTHWLTDNPHRHSVRQPTDKLHPTIVIDKLIAKDAGNYSLEVTLSSSVYQWMHFRWHFVTDLVVSDTNSDINSVVNDTDSDSNVTVSDNYAPHSLSNVSVAAIILGIAFVFAAIAIIVLMYMMKKKRERIDELEGYVSALTVPQSIDIRSFNSQSDDVVDTNQHELEPAAPPQKSDNEAKPSDGCYYDTKRYEYAYPSKINKTKQMDKKIVDDPLELRVSVHRPQFDEDSDIDQRPVNTMARYVPRTTPGNHENNDEIRDYENETHQSDQSSFDDNDDSYANE